MPRRDFLSADEWLRFDSPPHLNAAERLILVDIPQWAEDYLQAIHTPTNKIGFLLQLGYFRVVTRFFIPDRFPASDLEWVCRRRNILLTDMQMEDYLHNRTMYRHRTTILDRLGYQAFGIEHRIVLFEEAQRLTHLQTRPSLMLDALVSWLRERRIELSPYNTLREIIAGALEVFDQHLQTVIEQHLTVSEKALLDNLLDNTSANNSHGWPARYPLTELKQITQSMQPRAIAERVTLFNQLKQLFIPLAPVIARLDLSDVTLRYYAQ